MITYSSYISEYRRRSKSKTKYIKPYTCSLYRQRGTATSSSRVK